MELVTVCLDLPTENALRERKIGAKGSSDFDPERKCAYFSALNLFANFIKTE